MVNLLLALIDKPLDYWLISVTQGIQMWLELFKDVWKVEGSATDGLQNTWCDVTQLDRTSKIEKSLPFLIGIGFKTQQK